jgi:hypothetical protein
MREIGKNMEKYGKKKRNELAPVCNFWDELSNPLAFDFHSTDSKITVKLV